MLLGGATISTPRASPEEPAQRQRPLRYLIARHENNRLELLTLAAASRGESLSVFGNERAARDFLLGGGFGGGWRVRASTTGELISLLLGHLAGVEIVALDLRPGITTPDDVELRSREEFIEILMSEPLAVPSTALKPSASTLGGGSKR
jgi:hypothetical protein